MREPLHVLGAVKVVDVNGNARSKIVVIIESIGNRFEKRVTGADVDWNIPDGESTAPVLKLSEVVL